MLLFALLLAAPAQGAVVARDGDTVLRAQRNGDELCLSLKGTADFASRSCEPAPLSAFQPLFVSAFDGETPIAAAVPSRAREVEVEGRRTPTVAAAGFRERFFIVDAAEPAALLRFYDESGALIAAARYDEPRFGGGQRVVLRRAGVRISARRDFELRPDPLRVDRTVPSTCLTIRLEGSIGYCVTGRDLPALSLDVNRGCAPDAPVISGTVAPAVRRVELLLGSGRRIRLNTRPLPESFGDPARLVADRLPRGEAVRSARGIAADGTPLGRSPLRSAPGGLRCENGRGVSSLTAFGFGGGGHQGAQGDGAVVRTAAGHRLHAGDGQAADTICVAFDRPRAGCLPAPVDSTFFTLARAGNAVGGVLAGDVATVTLELDRGRPLTVATTAGPAYAGRFAGRLRFLAAKVPRGRLVERAVARDADGRRLGRGFVFGAFTNEVVARIPPALTVRRLGGGPEGSVRVGHCVRPNAARGLAAFLACRDRRDAVAVAYASCAPRRLLLFGYLPRGVRAVDVELGDRSRVAARVVRLGPEAGGGRVWTYVPDRDAAIRAVVYSDRPPRPFPRIERPERRQPFVLPPVAGQCGYDASDGF